MLILSVLNICLGFALALYLGFGPAEFRKTFKESNLTRVQETPEPDTVPSQELPSPGVTSINEPSPDYQQELQDSRQESQDLENYIFAEEMTLDAVCNDVT